MPDDSTFLGLPDFVWWALLFMLGIIFTVFSIRKAVEGIWPIIPTRPFWRERFLPILPIALGGIVAFFVKKYHYPEGIQTGFTRALYGMVLGGSSGWAFKILKAKVKTTYGVDIDLSNPPQQGAEINVKVTVPAQDKPPVIETTQEPK